MKTPSFTKTLALASLILLAPAAFAEVSPRISESAERLRHAQEGQFDSERHVQTIRERIRAKKEVISKTQSLKSKLISDLRKEQKLLDRDQGADDEAQQAREKLMEEKALRIEAAMAAIDAKKEELQALEDQLDEAKLGSKRATRERKSARAALKKIADEERSSQDCAERSFLGRIGGGIASLFDSVADIGRSRAQRDEHEIQKLVKRASCDPAGAVSERRLPKERETLADISDTNSVSRASTNSVSSAR